MNVACAVVTLTVTSAVRSFAEESKTVVGVMTKTMCAGNHAAMKISSDAKGVKHRVRDREAFH